MLLEAGGFGETRDALREASFRHVGPATVQVAAFAGGGADHLIEGREVSGAHLADAVYLQPDQHAVQRYAPDE